MDTHTHHLQVSARSPDQYARFLLNTIRLKGYSGTFTEKPDLQQVCLTHRNLVLVGFSTCMLYICERFPVPDLAPGDVVRRAIIRMQAKEILKQNALPPDIRTVAPKTRTKFILGNEPSLIDVAIISVTSPNDPQVGFIHASFNRLTGVSEVA